MTHKGFVAALMLSLGASLLAQNSAPDIAFDSTAYLLKTPDGVLVGEIGGVARNSKGQIFVYTRTGHPYATLGDNRTFSGMDRGSTSSTRTGSLFVSWARTSTGLTPRSGCGSIRRTMSGRSMPGRIRS